MSSNNEGSKSFSFEIDKLRGSDDYPSCRGNVRTILRASDSDLLGLQPAPTYNTASAFSAWRKAEDKAKAILVLNLGLVVKVRVRSYVDGDNADEKTALQL